jgi:hypothetical protein
MLTAKSIKATVVLDAAALLDITVVNGSGPVPFVITAGEQTLKGQFNAKTLRRAATASRTSATNRGPWEELRRGELAELEQRLRSLLLRSARLEEPRVQTYLNRVLALPRLRRHAYAPIIAISPPTSRRRRLVRRVRPRRVPPLPPGVWRRASRRAVRCGQPACAGQWRHRYGSGERLCMLR